MVEECMRIIKKFFIMVFTLVIALAAWAQAYDSYEVAMEWNNMWQGLVIAATIILNALNGGSSVTFKKPQ